MSVQRTTVITQPGLVITVAAMIHLTYAAALFMNREVGAITTLCPLVGLLGAHWGSSLLLFVGGLALLPRWLPMGRFEFQFYVWPQQTLLLLSLVSVLKSTWTGVYPDGTVKFGLFIFTDQCWIIYLTIAHLKATLRTLTYGPGNVVP